MTFDPKNKTLRIPAEDMRIVAGDLMAAIHYFRASSDLDVKGYSGTPKSTTCEKCILEAAKNLGIHLGEGSDKVGGLNVSNYR